MFHVLYNVETGALLSISEDQLFTAGHPVQVKTFQGDPPDLTRVEWTPSIASFTPRPQHVLTKLEYLRRFTQEERIAIRAAAKQSAQLEDYLSMLELAQDVTLSDPDTQGAVQMLEHAGLIAPGRAAEILG